MGEINFLIITLLLCGTVQVRECETISCYECSDLKYYRKDGMSTCKSEKPKLNRGGCDFCVHLEYDEHSWRWNRGDGGIQVDPAYDGTVKGCYKKSEVTSKSPEDKGFPFFGKSGESNEKPVPGKVIIQHVFTSNELERQSYVYPDALNAVLGFKGRSYVCDNADGCNSCFNRPLETQLGKKGKVGCEAEKKAEDTKSSVKPNSAVKSDIPGILGVLGFVSALLLW